ncbi:MAG: protein kinase [Acidobacteriota bacterium]
MSDSFIGRSLGKYQVEAKLGQGGMGKVYRGRQISLNRPVAIKVLTAHMAMDPEFVERFRQEARVIATLQHENIVHIYDVDDIKNADGDAIYFIAMELVDGYTLSHRPGAGSPAPPEQVRTIGAALARALDFAHRSGIVHRDIKGANVMVTGEGQVKLMDFGIAKSAGGVKTATGSVLGTPEYMAPEQARTGSVTAQSDIYSLGVLLYELATGRLPFTGSDPFAVALKHVSEMARRPRDVEPSIPEWLEDIILRCLAKDPADRFASAADLGSALQRASGRPLETRLPPAADVADVTQPLPTPIPPTPIRPTPPAPAAPTPPPPPPTGPETAVPPTRPAPSDSVLGTTVAAPPAGPTVPLDTTATPGAATAPSPPAGLHPQTGPAAASQGAPTPPPPGSRQTQMMIGLAGAAFLILAALGLWFALADGDPKAPRAAPPEETPSASTAATPNDAGVRITAQAPAASLSPQERAEAMARVRGALDADDARAARTAAAPLSGVRGDPEVAALIAEVEAAEMATEALGIVDEARANSDVPAAPELAGAVGAGSQPPPSNPGVAIVNAPAPPTTPPPAPPRLPSPEEFRRAAERQKDAEKYHSLKRTLDRWIQSGGATAEAHTWRGKVDRWIESREDDLRDELEDHLDDLEDTVEDRDLEDLAELWANRPDEQTRRYFRRLFERYAKLQADYVILESRPVDDRIDFVVEFRLRGREERRGPEKQIRTQRWRGRLVDDGELRFVSTFGG